MFLTKLDGYDERRNYIDSSSCITESISYTDFMYQCSLIESAILDNANHSATYMCQYNAGILTEAAMSDHLANAKERVAEIVERFKEMVIKLYNDLKAKLEENDKVKKVWLTVNKSKVLSTRVDATIPISENISNGLPYVSWLDNVREIFNDKYLSDIDDWKKNYAAPKLLGKGYTGDIDDLAAIKEHFKKSIRGETKQIEVNSINRSKLVESIGTASYEITKRTETIKEFTKINAKTISDSQDAHNYTAAANWFISVTNIIISEYSAAENEAFKVCKFIVSKANNSGNSKNKEEGKKNA